MEDAPDYRRDGYLGLEMILAPEVTGINAGDVAGGFRVFRGISHNPTKENDKGVTGKDNHNRSAAEMDEHDIQA